MEASVSKVWFGRKACDLKQLLRQTFVDSIYNYNRLTKATFIPKKKQIRIIIQFEHAKDKSATK